MLGVPLEFTQGGGFGLATGSCLGFQLLLFSFDPGKLLAP